MGEFKPFPLRQKASWTAVRRPHPARVGAVAAVALVAAGVLGRGFAGGDPLDDLNGGDRAAVESAIARVSAQGPGAVASWANADTHTEGMIFYLNDVTVGGKRCRDIAHRIEVPGSPAANVFRMRACEGTSGGWNWVG